MNTSCTFRSIHDTQSRFIAKVHDLLGHPSYIKRNGGFGTAKNAILPRLTSWRYDVNISKQKKLLDGVDVGTPKWRISIGCLIDHVHEAMNPSLMLRFILGLAVEIFWNINFYNIGTPFTWFLCKSTASYHY